MPAHLGWPHRAWLSFIELDKAVVPVIRLAFSVIMVSVCLPSDALWQHLPSYLAFSYFGHRESLYGCSSKVQPLLLTLDEGYHQMVNTKIRLIIFFAAEDGEALYSQQKQDWELTVTQTMNFLLKNSD